MTGASPNDLWAALALVAVIEGMILFVAPRLWKQTAAEALKQPDRRLRMFGLGAIVLGLIALHLVRG